MEMSWLHLIFSWQEVELSFRLWFSEYKHWSSFGYIEYTKAKYCFVFVHLPFLRKMFFRQTFMAEVGLDKNLFTLKTTAGKSIGLTLVYVETIEYDLGTGDYG